MCSVSPKQARPHDPKRGTTIKPREDGPKPSRRKESSGNLRTPPWEDLYYHAQVYFLAGVHISRTAKELEQSWWDFGKTNGDIF